MIENKLVRSPKALVLSARISDGALMATFGSLSLLIALALAAYNLFAGGVALRLLATGQPAPHFS